MNKLATILLYACASVFAAELVPLPLRPVTIEDSADLQTWDVVVDNCTNLTVAIMPVGNHFFRARLERCDSSFSVVVPFNAEGLRLWNGPASNGYVECFDIALPLPHPQTNKFTITPLTVYPTNHLAAQCYIGDSVSDFSPEIEAVFAQQLIIAPQK